MERPLEADSLCKPESMLALTPEMYEDIRKDAQDFVERRKKSGIIKTPEDERIDRQAYTEALLELWPAYKPKFRDLFNKKRMEISLR